MGEIPVNADPRVMEGRRKRDIPAKIHAKPFALSVGSVVPCTTTGGSSP